MSEVIDWTARLAECKKNVPCVDCDNTRCWFRGKKESDCPKYRCDNEKSHDCDNCEFIDRFIADMRGENYERN